MGWEMTKTKIEFDRWKRVLKVEWEEVKDNPGGITHHYVDFFVEAHRAMPYTTGHIAAFAVPLGILGWFL